MAIKISILDANLSKKCDGDGTTTIRTTTTITSTRTIITTTISQLLLNRFLPNFKVSFFGSTTIIKTTTTTTKTTTTTTVAATASFADC